jgi:DNA-binding beta-propeller fold protein YncE
VFDLSGKYLFDFGSKDRGPGQLDTPEAAKVSSDGKLYVTDLRNNRIQIFDTRGRYLSLERAPAGKRTYPAHSAIRQGTDAGGLNAHAHRRSFSNPLYRSATYSP